MKYFSVLKKVLIILMLTVMAAVVPVGAISSGNDEIYLAQPLEAEIVDDQYQVRWFMKEADQSKIPFQVDLFYKICPNNGKFFGIVSEGEKQSSTGGRIYSVGWDTDGPIKDRSTVKDGYYCLRVCAVFRRSPNNFYALCDKRSVQVVNSNKLPRITSKPPETLDYTVGEKFSHKIEATDPDGDKLTFKLTSPPFFLQINKNTGIISTKDVLPKAGNFKVTAVVADGKGGTSSQVFTLNVTEDETSFKLIFLSPTDDTVFTKKDNTIEWEISGEPEVKNLSISYSVDTDSWTEIVSFEEDPGKYSWDVTELPSYTYFLRIRVEDNEENLFEKISDEFVITNNEDGGEEIPVITNIKPESDADITDRRPVIGATIGASEGAELSLEQITVKLDKEKIDSCTFDNGKLICKSESDLAVGRHQIFLEVTDSDGKQTVKEWFFEIMSEIEPTPIPEEGGEGEIDFFGRKIPTDTFTMALGILCIGLLLLLVPWFIYILLSRRRGTDTDVYEQGYAPEAGGGGELTYAPAEPAPVSQQPMVTYTESTPTEPAPDYEPSIGDQTLGEEETASPQTDYTPVTETPPQEMHMPSIYESSTEEDVPDWLKVSDEASTPVVPTGEDFEVSGQAKRGESSPYQDYGLASQNETDAHGNR